MKLSFQCSIRSGALCAAALCWVAPALAQAGAADPPAIPSTPQTTSPNAADQLALRHLVDTGHADEALTRIAALRADGQPHPGLDTVAGLADFAKGDLQAADREFAAALHDQPANREALEMRGLVLVKLGRPADAIPLLEAIARDGSTGTGKADPHYALALCYIDVRRYDDARGAFAAQFGFAPGSAQAYLLTARMLLRRDFVPIALDFAQKAVALNPALPGSHELIGEIALAQGRTSDAIHELQLEQTRSPLDGAVYDRLGDALNRAGRYDEAQLTLQKALLLEPNATGPYILLGKTLMKRNDAPGAAMYLERAEQMDPANYMTHNLLGQAYRTMGRTEQARRETQLAEKMQHATEPAFTSLH